MWDHVLNSHDHSVLLPCVITRRNLTPITPGAKGLNNIFTLFRHF